MKKILVMALAFAMIISMTACGKKEDAEQIANPNVQYDSLQKLDGDAGVALMPIGNAENESYYLITESTAEYNFTLNGIEYCYRADPGTYEDISGVYENGKLIFDNFHPGNDDPVDYEMKTNYKICRWFSDGQIQYVLVAYDNGKLSEAEFKTVAESCMADTGVMLSHEFYDDLEGEYSDSISQRAYMEVSSVGYEGVVIRIWWSSSAAEKDYWEMEAKVTGTDGLLTYEWGTHERISFADENDQEGTTELIADQLSGYFEIDDEHDSLIWSGAPEESCKDCVFVEID